MKKLLPSIVIIVLLLFIVWKYILPKQEVVDLKPYERKIDSLNIKVDSLNKQNDSLETFITFLYATNDSLFTVNQGLKYRISDLKRDLEEAENALKYTPHQIDSFFLDRYSHEYVPDSQDTIYIPIEVAKSIIVDVKQGDINKQIVTTQDSTIDNLEELVANKEEIIKSLRDKEINYIQLDKTRLDQQAEYQKQIDLLKLEVKKYNKKLKISKIKEILIGAAAVVGFVITNK